MSPTSPMSGESWIVDHASARWAATSCHVGSEMVPVRPQEVIVEISNRMLGVLLTRAAEFDAAVALQYR